MRVAACRIPWPGGSLIALGFAVIAILPRVEAEETVREAKRVAIVVPANASAGEQEIAAILKKRIQKRSKVDVQIRRDSERAEGTNPDVEIVVRRAAAPAAKRPARPANAVPTLEDGPLPPEAFYVHTDAGQGPFTIFAEGADASGEMYAAGEVLRRLKYLPDSIQVRAYSIKSAPAFRWRGSSANQGGTMRQVTGARGWSQDEVHDCLLDYALAGANTFYAGGAMHDYVKQFGLKTVEGCRPNELPGGHREWRKPKTDRGQFVCPSIPEAHAALVKYWDERFAKAKDADVLRFFSGDPGGCRCEQCEPWGKTFLLLCAELAHLWKKHHPHSEVQICNQDLTNEGDLAIFDSLNSKPHDWLNSMSYGPGSNAMSPYFRDELRRDLFIYPGQGPINRYLAFTLQNLPKDMSICHYSDITHWISAQYQCEHPEPHLVAVYGRRTFHQRPAAMYRTFQRIMPFAEGDIIYSEGHHDELHQHLWNRMLWNPNRRLRDLMTEYAEYYFGEKAAPEMIQASMQLEKNLEAPIESNDGVERYYALAKSAGAKIPANLMAVDYRWREHMQKAALDKCLKFKVRLQDQVRESAYAELKSGLSSASLKETVAGVNELLNKPLETDETRGLREEANRLGEESDKIFGVRNTGYFNLSHDFVGLRWLKGEVAAMAKVAEPDKLCARVKECVEYEDPGPGGFYDDAGSPGRQPHLTLGSVRNPAFRALLDPKNRPSANTFVFNRSGPVVFTYTGLDPKARYKTKVTLVTARINPQMAQQFGIDVRNLKRTESIWANDVVLAKDLDVPLYTAKQFEFDLPEETTHAGKLELKFERPENAGPAAAAVVSEIWIMKR